MKTCHNGIIPRFHEPSAGLAVESVDPWIPLNRLDQLIQWAQVDPLIHLFNFPVFQVNPQMWG